MPVPSKAPDVRHALELADKALRRMPMQAFRTAEAQRERAVAITAVRAALAASGATEEPLARRAKMISDRLADRADRTKDGPLCDLLEDAAEVIDALAMGASGARPAEPDA